MHRGWTLLILCIAVLTSKAQKTSIEHYPTFYQEIVNAEKSHQVYPLHLQALPTPSDTKSFASSVNHAEFYTFDNHDYHTKEATIGTPHMVEMTIPFKGSQITCLFERQYLTATNYIARSAKPSSSQKTNAYFYRGIVKGEPNSWATLAIIDGKYKGLVAYSKGNLEINHIDGNTYAVYASKDQKKVPDFICGYEDKPIKTGTTSKQRVGSDCLELYIECDFQSYQDNGNSVSATEAWALSIINDVATLYATINVPIVVSDLFVWNTDDPYINQTNLTTVRDSFVDHIQANYNGRVAQLFSTRPLSGGLAYGLGGFCGTYPDFPGPYSIATELSTTYDPYPNFSFTVNVVAHELGHVLGARHTHACVWGPNNDAQIDDCGNVYASNTGGTPEGTGCYDSDNPILPTNGGTVMSFCNLAGGGIDLANGFGTEVGDYIFEEYTTAVCATGGLCASIPPSNDDCINAIALKLQGQCSFVEYDNIMATSSGVSDPSCGTVGSAIDVWFSITPQNTDVLLYFSPQSGQVENVIITAYSGTCGNLTELKCDEIFNEDYEIKLSGLTPNEPIYIRLIEEGSDLEGSFLLCAVDQGLPCHPAFNALVDLYNASNGNSWTNNTGWVDGALGTNCSPCTWYGVTCDNLDNVIALDLTNNNLSGTVPSSMDALVYLRSIKLLINNLSGDFPDIWSTMPDLEYIDLSNNQFTGTMPTSLGNLMKLTTLYIENNMMSGSLLPAIGTLPLLNVYWAKNNNFSGCFPGTYLQLCDIGSITFTNNPMLPNGGDFDLFCTDGTGGDIDEDGFCFGTGPNDDCVDSDNTIYPNAPEICDGKDNDCDGLYDENLTVTNTWIPAGGGSWQDPSNWSQGDVPRACEDIFIPSSTATRTVEIPSNSTALGRSVIVGQNSILDNMGILTISGSDDQGLSIELGGNFINYDTLEILNISIHGILNAGYVENNGTINVSNLGNTSEINILQSGQLRNNPGSQINVND